MIVVRHGSLSGAHWGEILWQMGRGGLFMASPKLVEPDRDEGAVHLETTPWVSEDSGPSVLLGSAEWFRHGRSLALTSWLNQHPVN